MKYGAAAFLLVLGLRVLGPIGRLPEHEQTWVQPDLLDILGGGVVGREVELGSFLTPEERESLHDDLSRRLRTA